MHDMICPHCAKAFKIDESGYADIVKQVRDEEFKRQLHERNAHSLPVQMLPTPFLQR